MSQTSATPGTSTYTDTAARYRAQLGAQAPGSGAEAQKPQPSPWFIGPDGAWHKAGAQAPTIPAPNPYAMPTSNVYGSSLNVGMSPGTGGTLPQHTASADPSTQQRLPTNVPVSDIVMGILSGLL